MALRIPQPYPVPLGQLLITLRLLQAQRLVPAALTLPTTTLPIRQPTWWLINWLYPLLPIPKALYMEQR